MPLLLITRLFKYTTTFNSKAASKKILYVIIIQ